jgi:hypothetical protein
MDPLDDIRLERAAVDPRELMLVTPDRSLPGS